MANQVSVRSAVFESLHSILSANKEERDCGEERLKVLEVTEDFGLVLTEICIDADELAAMKQLAAVLLRQYVDVHWSEDAEKFSPPETPTHVRVAIRSLIPRGLTEPDSRVRSIAAYVISSIAHWDWPEQWPQLFELLMQALSSSNKDAVHGSMRVLTEFTRDITDTQMTQIAPVLLPELYRIFIATGQYINRSRSRAVVIFTTCVNVIISLGEVDKGYVKQLLVPVLPKFIEAFIEALCSKNTEVTDTGIKTEIMKALIALVRGCRSHIAQHFKSIVTSVWRTLVDSSEQYLQTNIYDAADDLEEDPVDSDGESLGTEALIYSVFEFINVLVDSPKFHPVIKENMKQLLYYITIYTQISTEQEDCWTQSPNQFVEDEDDDSFSFSVRISAQELLQVIIGEFGDLGLIALAENIPAHLQQAQEMKQANNSGWWKVHEAILLALGKVPHMFIGAIQSGTISLNLTDFLHNVILSDLMHEGTPFLTGRCMWLASKMSHQMDGPLLQKFLEATVTGLSDTQPPCVRISSVRATYYFCENLMQSKQAELLNPILPLLFEGAMSIAQAYGTEVLALCLETMEIILRINRDFTSSIAEKSMPLFMAVFLKYSHDQHIIEICRELIVHLAAARPDIVQQRMLPTLVSIIQQQHPESLPSTLQPGSLEMIETLVRGCTDTISAELMAVFPMVANLTIATDDSSIMQNGGECLRAFISKSAQQVVMWQDEQGHTGLSIIGSVVSKLLDPKAPECSAAYVGKLVSLLISKLSDSIGADLDLMLRAVLSKLQRTDTPTIVQELIMVFARLVLSKVEALLDFLTMTPGPDGGSALKFVLTQWCSRQELFYGSYETKVSSIALSKLLQHAINTNDLRLQEITLKEEVLPQSSVIRTRSKAKAATQQWTDTPILIKMYKLLINELAHQLEESQFTPGSNGNGHGIGEGGDYKDVGDDDDDDDEGPEWLSNLIDANLLDEEDGDETDPDVLSDPLYHLNLKEYLVDFIKSFSQTQHYETFSRSLSSQEQSVLNVVGVVAAS